MSDLTQDLWAQLTGGAVLPPKPTEWQPQQRIAAAITVTESDLSDAELLAIARAIIPDHIRGWLIEHNGRGLTDTPEGRRALQLADTILAAGR